MRDINERVGQYLFSLCVVYAGVAALATVALALLGFPNAIVWGALMGLASFVPFIGPAVMVAAVALVALLTFDDWTRIVAVPASLLAIHLVESQFMTPMFLSRRCALNTVAVFVSIALLGWMWGAIGAIVAVPLLILFSTIAAHLPSLRWLEVLLADPRRRAPHGAQAVARLGGAAAASSRCCRRTQRSRGGAARPEIDEAREAPERADDRPCRGGIDLALEQDDGGCGQAARADRHGSSRRAPAPGATRRPAPPAAGSARSPPAGDAQERADHAAGRGWRCRRRGRVGRSSPAKEPACQEADAEDGGERREGPLLGVLDQGVARLLLELGDVLGHRLGLVAVLGDQLARRAQRLLESLAAALEAGCCRCP